MEATPGPGDVDTRVHVVVTNLGLTLLLLLILVLTSAVFNSTIEANRDRIAAWWRRWLGHWPWPRLRPPVRIVAVLVVTGSLYGLLSPGFRFDRAGVLLLFALAAGLGALTGIGEGGAAWFARHRLGVRAGVRVQLAAVVAALACVLITRATEFQPTILYGFVASTAVVGTLDRSQNGRAAFYPALMVLGAGLAAFAVLGALRSGSGGGWVHDAAEALMAVVFVAGIEGAVFSMVPITFMDGRAVFDWSRWRWASLTGIAVFCFWQLLVNPDGAYLDAFRQPAAVAVLVIAGGFVTVTAATWAWFRWGSAAD